MGAGALGERACGRCWACRAHARLGVLGAGAAGARALGRQALGRTGQAGARSAGGHAAGLAERWRAGGAGERAAGHDRSARKAGEGRARRTAWARGARGLGVPVRAGWACWLVSWASFGAQCTWLSFNLVFDRFDSIFLLSH